MKLVSWNVNWIRSWIKKWTFFKYLEYENPDIIWLQEIKAKFEQLEQSDIEKIKNFWYQIYWNPAVKLGYSWTAILSKIKALNIYYWIDTTKLLLNELEIDKVIKENYEWRVITAEYKNFYFITVYTPNSKPDLSRLEYRKIWDNIFLKYLNFLQSQKPIIFCWDLNVAHKEIDLANPSINKTTKTRPWNAWFTDIERAWIQEFINNKYIDTFRYFYPNITWSYTWWSNFWNARLKNIWWRIDYFLISEILKSKLKSAFINQKVIWSDHCPIWIQIFE